MVVTLFKFFIDDRNVLFFIDDHNVLFFIDGRNFDYIMFCIFFLWLQKAH